MMLLIGGAHSPSLVINTCGRVCAYPAEDMCSYFGGHRLSTPSSSNGSVLDKHTHNRAIRIDWGRRGYPQLPQALRR
jgi:hypothetical protein